MNNKRGALTELAAMLPPQSASNVTGGRVAHTPWCGELSIGEYWASWRGRSGDATFHKHLAAQIVQHAEGVDVITANNRCIRGTLILIDPLVVHRIRPGTEDVLVTFLEPSAVRHPALRDILEVCKGSKDPSLIDHGTAPFWTPWLRGEGSTLLNESSDFSSILKQIDDRIPDGALRLRPFADLVGLSESRFRHLFAESTGLPFRRYVLWRRARRAAMEMTQGADATTAAHSAGFADLAHFARTLKTMFGITSSQLVSLPHRAHNSG